MRFPYLPICILLFFSGTALAQTAIGTQGGNLSHVEVYPEINGSVWHGIFGNASPLQFTNATLNATPDGVTRLDANTSSSACENGADIQNVLFSNSSQKITSLSPGNLAVLDDFISRDLQNGTGTFTLYGNFSFAAFGNVTGVPMTYTQPESSGFRMGYLQDQSGNLVFATAVLGNRTTFNGSVADYQLMLPTRNGSDTEYYLTVDLSCKGGGGGGGGGGGSGGGGGGGSGGGGGGGASDYGYSTQPSTNIYVDIGNGTLCKINVRRTMTVNENYTIITTTLTNLGGPECVLDDFAFVDVIPPDFAAIWEIDFSPEYFSASGNTVMFIFPVFSPNESITIVYSVGRAIAPSKITSLNSTRLVTSTKIDTTVYVNGEPVMPQVLPSECIPEIFCGQWGPCEDGYRSQRCIDINRCAEPDFFRVEPCFLPGPRKTVTRQLMEEIEQEICAAFPALCTFEPQDRSGICWLLLLVLLLVLAAVLLSKRRKRKHDEYAHAAGRHKNGRKS